MRQLASCISQLPTPNICSTHTASGHADRYHPSFLPSFLPLFIQNIQPASITLIYTRFNYVSHCFCFPFVLRRECTKEAPKVDADAISVRSSRPASWPFRGPFGARKCLRSATTKFLFHSDDRQWSEGSLEDRRGGGGEVFFLETHK